jgi:pyridoxal phosphate enzyme (YggS family)
MQTIAERLKLAHNAIEVAATEAQRYPHSVQLLAVSKTKPVSEISQAYAAGQRLFGENYIQEGVEKVVALKTLSDIEWHMIGPIQSNKTKAVAEHFDWVQSVDRLKIARRLSEQRPENMAPLNICLQVNIDREDTKSGVLPEQLNDLIEQVSALPNIVLRGLMAIPTANATPEQQAASFTELSDLFRHYQAELTHFDTLSLGMSNDMATAIQYGSTMVRLGTAIFGARQ